MLSTKSLRLDGLHEHDKELSVALEKQQSSLENEILFAQPKQGYLGLTVYTTSLYSG